MIFITGAYGFIGSCLASRLLKKGFDVVAFDNLSSGNLLNLPCSSSDYTGQLTFFKGDVRSRQDLRAAISGCSSVIHLAAMVSVPRSLASPLECHEVNVDGFQNVLEAARQAGIRKVVYSSSSAVYGNQTKLPIQEKAAGRALSPYGSSKFINEILASTYSEAYGFQTVGLRYFNVFGPKQNPQGGYAAVIPKWIDAILHGSPVLIHGDGSTTRDFIYVEDVAEINIRSLLAEQEGAFSKILNAGSGQDVSLINLYNLLEVTAKRVLPELQIQAPKFLPPRAGDIQASVADISQMNEFIKGYQLTDFEAALEETFKFFAEEQAGFL
jgi:UDP-N-acetylglucosamine 4-epimerase